MTKIFTCPRRDEAGKFYGVVQAFREIWRGRVLDIGCRSAKLKEVLHQHNKPVEYCGVDLYPPADIIADLEMGLPFEEEEFDVVVALDVLEHTDDIYKAFDEICRVTSQFVVITLPNAYELKGRIKFVLGFPLSGKYGLPIDPPADRHRWLFSFTEARKFVKEGALRRGFTVKDEGCLIGPRRARVVGNLLSGRFPNLLSPSYLCLLIRKERVAG